MASLKNTPLQAAGAVVAFVLALCGTEALKRPAARPWGFGLLALGTVLGAVLLRNGLRPLVAAVPGGGAAAGSRARLGRLGLAFAALLLVWADARRLGDEAQAFGATEALWGISIALLAISSRLLSRRVETGPRASPAELALLAAVVAAGLAVRLVALRDIPFAIHGDEILTGRYAQLHFLPWKGTTLFRTVWKGIELPALWFAIVAGSLKVFGATLAAVRLPAALFGAATLVPFWALTRGMYGRRAALLATALLACGTANVHFARVTLNNITTPFFWTLCFVLLLDGLRRARPFSWALAGLVGGLGEHFYYGTRLLPFLLLAFFAHLWLTERGLSAGRLREMALVAFGYLAGFGLLLVCFATSPGLYFGRGVGVLAWNPAMNPGSFGAVLRTLGERAVTNVLGVGSIPGDDTVYFAPLFCAAEAALFWLGLGMLFRRWRDPAAFLMLSAALGTLLVGGTLIPPAPAPNHWTPAFAAFYTIAAAPLAGWLGLGDRLGRPAGLAITGAAVAGVFAIAVSNLDFYVHRYYAVRPEFEIRAAQARMQAALGPRYRVFTVGNTWQPYNAELNSYLVDGQTGGQIHDPERQLRGPSLPGHGLAFFFFDDTLGWLPRVRALYPCGAQTPVTSRGGAPFFTTYVVTPLQARRCAPAALEK